MKLYICQNEKTPSSTTRFCLLRNLATSQVIDLQDQKLLISLTILKLGIVLNASESLHILCPNLAQNPVLFLFYQSTDFLGMIALKTKFIF